MPLRPYDQDQMFFLPPSLNEWVREDHPVRVFSEIIDRINTTSLQKISLFFTLRLYHMYLKLFRSGREA